MEDNQVPNTLSSRKSLVRKAFNSAQWKMRLQMEPQRYPILDIGKAGRAPPTPKLYVPKIDRTPSQFSDFSKS
jgi:hypothetical protein